MIKLDSTRIAAACVAMLGFLTPLTGQSAPEAPPEPAVDQRIDYYNQKLVKHPTLFAVYVQLAAAYMEKARATNDPQWLKLAETNLEKSLKIQSNFEALKGMTALYDFRHRFAEALRWAERTKPGPEETDVIALMVEARLGLGETEIAAQLLPPLDSQPKEFYTAASMAAVLKAQGRYNEAHAMFLKAEQFALAQKITSVAVWARTNAAGMLIDSGQAAKALPDLEAATAMQKDNPELRLHWAEYHEALDEPAKAYEILEALTKESAHPAYHHRAYKLARKLGDKAAAKRHLAAAEQNYRLPLKAKEIYTLGSLAQLYCDAGTRLNEALKLAQRNLEYKRDKEATDALACVQGKLPKPKKTAH